MARATLQPYPPILSFLCLSHLPTASITTSIGSWPTTSSDGEIGTRPEVGTVSIFWSPLLVKVAEKAELAGVRHNNVFLDSLDERWVLAGRARRVRPVRRGKAGDRGGISVGAWGLVARGGRRDPGSLPLPRRPLAFPSRSRHLRAPSDAMLEAVKFPSTRCRPGCRPARCGSRCTPHLRVGGGGLDEIWGS
jgi:hypothetical protein